MPVQVDRKHDMRVSRGFACIVSCATIAGVIRCRCTEGRRGCGGWRGGFQDSKKYPPMAGKKAVS
jgi:hypothetical protein